MQVPEILFCKSTIYIFFFHGFLHIFASFSKLKLLIISKMMFS